ncbi:MAG: DUF1858 domain-containing protein [Candidatus Aenigmarchaeota archaeon]|nr:DUF1858 domain-containing protein [Candidatus Aenigmarchaeota archaeon]
MTLGEVVSKYPSAAVIMLKYGLHCAGCGAAAFETIEEGAKAHEMNEKTIEKMLDEMNKKIKKMMILKNIVFQNH